MENHKSIKIPLRHTYVLFQIFKDIIRLFTTFIMLSKQIELVVYSSEININSHIRFAFYKYHTLSFKYEFFRYVLGKPNVVI